ncbi:LOW QUALITY PROTEIN: hypothetical protein OpiT1DRAFT_02368 [Opitutaceae bacterium TAV1]|nr:LOW QUALITY PROTEIN: hypothetical protein OpiT1DRAFT_02368 [Opitutaceae bacterium TAV1]
MSSSPPLHTAWATACAERRGERIFRTASASSAVSQDDARRLARALAETRARAAADGVTPPALDGGTYPYPERVLVEPVLQRLTLPAPGSAAVELARITRNSYDASVLNAYRVMFVDVDTAPDSSNAGDEETVPQGEALDALVGLTRRQPDLAFRMYATRAGLRYLCISRLFDPVSDDSRSILAGLRADKRYATLCRVQKCYRARLTSKHWRCLWTPPAPPPESRPRGFFARLLHAASAPSPVTDPARFATCRYLETVGSPPRTLPPEIDLVLRHHDTVTEAATDKPLA